MWGAASYFLFVRVDILPAFSCGIMIKPDSILLSPCCIISMGQYFRYYQSNLEYLQRCVWISVCVCVFAPVLPGGTLHKSEWREPESRGSNKDLVPPCARWRNCSLFGAFPVPSLFACLLVSSTCHFECSSVVKLRYARWCTWQTKQVIPLKWTRPWKMWAQIFRSDEKKKKKTVHKATENWFKRHGGDERKLGLKLNYLRVKTSKD